MKKKKWAILAFSILLAIVSSFQFSLALKAKDYTTYKIEVTKDNTITGVTINNTVIDLLRYVSDDVEVKEDRLVAKNDKGEITIMTSVIDNVDIKYDDKSKDMNVYKDDTKLETEDSLFSVHSNIIQDLKMSLNKYTLLFLIVFGVIHYLLLWYAVRVITRVKNGEVKVYQIMLLTIDIFVIYVLTFYTLLYAIRQYSVLIPIGVIAAILWYLKDTFNEKKENLYISIAIIAGITMLFLVPPFNVPDEYAHFIKSYYMTVTDKQGQGYEKFPESITNFSFKYVQGMTIRTTKYNAKNYLSDFIEDGNYSVKSENEKGYGNTFNLSPVPYIFSAITVGLGRILNFSPLLLILIAKITDLLITIALGYIVIREVPKFKNAFLIVLLLPMLLHQAAAINMDYLTNIIAIAFTAFAIKYKERNAKITIKNEVILGILAIMLAYCKFGYFPVLLLVLLIPNDNFKSEKEASIYKIGIIVLPSVLSYLKNTGFGSVDTPYYSLKDMITNPFKMVKIFYNTAVERLPLDLFTGQFDGFGLSTQWLPALYSTISVFIFVLLYATSGNDEKIDLKERLFFLFVGLLIIGAVYSGLLVGWTPKGSWTVNGLQPRYFLPALFLILLGSANNKIKLNVKNKSNFMAIAMFSIYLISLYFIAKGFY